jgi:hypothetical protein
VLITLDKPYILRSQFEFGSHTTNQRLQTTTSRRHEIAWHALDHNQDELDHSSSNTTNPSSSSASHSSSAAYNSSIALPSNNTNAAAAVAAADNHPTASNPSSTEGTYKMAYTSLTLAEVQQREVSSHQNPKPPQQKEDDYSSSSISAHEQSSESESEEERGAKKHEEKAAFNSCGGAKVKMGSGRGRLREWLQ